MKIIRHCALVLGLITGLTASANDTLNLDCSVYVSCGSGSGCTREVRTTHGFWREDAMPALNFVLKIEPNKLAEKTFQIDTFSKGEKLIVRAMHQTEENHSLNLTISRTGSGAQLLGEGFAMISLGATPATGLEYIVGTGGRPEKTVNDGQYNFYYHLSCTAF